MHRDLNTILCALVTDHGDPYNGGCDIHVLAKTLLAYDVIHLILFGVFHNNCKCNNYRLYALNNKYRYDQRNTQKT